jgi:hypothetical protein
MVLPTLAINTASAEPYGGHIPPDSQYAVPAEPITTTVDPTPTVTHSHPGMLEQIVDGLQNFADNRYVQFALIGVGAVAMTYLAYSMYCRYKIKKNK